MLSENSEFLRNHAEHLNEDGGFPINHSSEGPMHMGQACRVSPSSGMEYFSNFNQKSGYFGGQNGALNGDFFCKIKCKIKTANGPVL